MPSMLSAAGFSRRTPHLALRLVWLLLIWLLLVWASSAAASDWPMFRGQAHLGVAGDVALPVTWNLESGENVRWRVELPGLGLSSPIAWGDLLFVTTAIREQEDVAELKTGLYGDITPVADEGAHSFVVMALERASGKVVWQQVAHQGVPKVKRHPKSSHANSTPATDGKRVIAMFGSEGLYAYDLEGKLLWKKDLGLLDSGYFQAPGAQWGFASSPLLYEDKVILQVDVQKDSYLAAFDAATGAELWRTPREEVPTWGSPTIARRGDAGGLQIVVNGWKHIGGYELESGKELWKLGGGGDIPVPTPVVARGVEGHGDLILITNAHGRMRPIYAVRTDAAGEITPESPAIPWWHERLGNYMQTPIVHDGLGYFCFDNGVLTVLDLASGERLYQERLGTGSTGFTASAVAGDGKIYFTSEDGEVHVVAAGRTFAQLAVNELGEQSMASPAIVGDQLLFRGRRHLVAVGLTSP